MLACVHALGRIACLCLLAAFHWRVRVWVYSLPASTYLLPFHCVRTSVKLPACVYLITFFHPHACIGQTVC